MTYAETQPTCFAEGQAPAPVHPTTMHVMLDLETLGKTPGSVIASIGAVAFDPLAGAFRPEFYAVVDRASCEAVGLEVDPDTLAWWARQSEEARSALAVDPMPLREALAAFTTWWREMEGERLWSQGANFDEPILAAAYRACGMAVPWKYHASRDTRTVYELAGVVVERGKGVHHNALDDALAQVDAVCRAHAHLHLGGALADIGAERRRQVVAEGWTSTHDDEHPDGELALAAACYAMFASASDRQRAATDLPASLTTTGEPVSGWAAFRAIWPWDREFWKPKDRRRDLVRAAALIVAEIERLDRKAARERAAR